MKRKYQYKPTIQLYKTDPRETIDQNRKKDRVFRESEELSKETIPLDPRDFYNDFGPIPHPKTGEPAQLTDYQYNVWNSDKRITICIKSQKVGMSTIALRQDFQLAITKYAGKDILIIAQTQDQANEHLRTLKTDILNSEKYSKYLITNISEYLLKEEKSKVGVAFIKNPNNPLKPSRIVALGPSESATWSWKNVGHIHFSDITATRLVDDTQLFAAAFSRLANTEGTILIETPPRRPKGKVYELYEKYYLDKKPTDQIKFFIVKAMDAVKAGLITEKFLEGEKENLGPLYSQFYEAEFLNVGGNVFPNDDIEHCLLLGDMYPFNGYPSRYRLHLGGVDFGFSSSKTTVYVGEVDKENNIVNLIYGVEYDKKTPSYIANIMFSLHRQIPNLWFFVDGANRGAVNECKIKFGESINWEKVKDISPDDNRIIPVNFHTDHEQMLEHLYHMVVKHRLAIPRKYQKLVNSLRTAWAEGFDLDKDQTMDDDHLDAVRLLLSGVKEDNVDND